MSQENIAKLACSGCKRINYRTHKNKRLGNKLELKKLCPFCKTDDGKKGVHILHKETK